MLAQHMGEVGEDRKDLNVMRTIADEIHVITEIAFQTNILALNAAVEAARLHGRICRAAAEVRRLAERSKVTSEKIELSNGGVAAIQNPRL